ncbi:MAG TPA: glycosyltransferase family 39 protein [Acidimicrobiales bacterium]|nr:glycosyltransferase family 39 protein [Acidimicrobiales bacterium]
MWLVPLVAASGLLRWEGRHAWFWIDEGISVGIASHSLAELPGVLRQDGAPPLYSLVLHLWMRLFGDGEAATHALSWTFALACIPVAWWAGRTVFGERTGRVAAVLAAGLPFLTAYANETRPYTLLALLSLLVATTCTRALLHGERRMLPAFAASLVAMLYTHAWGGYVAAAAVAAVAAVWARSRYRRPRLARDGALSFGVAALCFAPWLPILLHQVRHTGAPWSRVPGPEDALRQLGGLAGDQRVLAALLVAAAALAPLVAGRGRVGREARTVQFLGVLFVLPVVLAWVGTQVEPSWAARYLAVVLGPALLLVAHGLARAGVHGVVALLVALVVWIDPVARLAGEAPEPRATRKSNVRTVTNAFAGALRPGDVVVSTQFEQVPVLRYYLRTPGLRFATPLGPVADPTVADWRDIEERLAAADVGATARSLLDPLAPGTHVVLVSPRLRPPADAPEWFDLFLRLDAEWRAALVAHPRLRAGPVVGDPPEGRRIRNTSVRAALFTVER